MNLRLTERAARPVLVCESPVERAADALDVVSASFEHRAPRLLLDETDLPDAFFELKSGFAGEFVQKLINYRITTAAVFRGSRPYSQRFREYIDEARSGRQFRAFSDATAALAWLETQ